MVVKSLTNNWGLKLISFVLAVGLWNYALGEEGIEVKRTIPLEIKVANSQISLLKTSTQSVTVTLLAPRSALSDMTAGEIQAVHELGKDVKSAGDYSFRLQPRDIKLPTPQIRVVSIEPEVVQATLDELIVQKIAVKPNFVGEPAFGYTVDEEGIQLDPNAILIEGPKDQLEIIKSVLTEPLDLVGRIRSFRRTVSLNMPANVKPLSEGLIDVYVPIKEEFQEKSFENIKVKIIRSSKDKEKITIEPAEISFDLKGSVRHLDKLDAEKMVAYIDITELEMGEMDVPVQIVLPEDVALVGDGPVIVRVNIKKK